MQKIANEVVFRRFQDEESDFFKSDLTDPPQIFDAHLLENTNSRYLFFAELAISERWSAIFCITGV